ncbi:DUF2797 domain-containing protein [Pseudomonadota bacterium]
MRSELGGVVQYTLPLYDVLEENELVPMNQLIGKTISIRFDGSIHCVVTGKKIKKAYGEGMSYEYATEVETVCAVESIIRPELCQAHLGIALRDLDWEVERHVKPHYVYLSLTSGIKVGVTRNTQIPTRWIDQGAVKALLLAETPYRQASGLIEVALKAYIADKTNWRNMLKNTFTNATSLEEEKSRLKELIPDELKQYCLDDDSVTSIEYPVLRYPEKVTSMKLDKVPEIEKQLVGIKGQYLIFDDNTVMNMRSHAGFQITIEA